MIGGVPPPTITGCVNGPHAMPPSVSSVASGLMRLVPTAVREPHNLKPSCCGMSAPYSHTTFTLSKRRSSGKRNNVGISSERPSRKGDEHALSRDHLTRSGHGPTERLCLLCEHHGHTRRGNRARLSPGSVP